MSDGMHQVELIVCDDRNGFETEVFVSIPEELHAKKNTDEVADWVIFNVDGVGDKATYIGVYNWNDENEELQG